MNILLLVDGNAIMHRAFHALPPFTTKSGIPTNAAFGFISILNKVITDFQPYYLIVCFDTPVPTFRKKIFKDYQAHRPKMEDVLSRQFPLVKEALDDAGIVHLEKEGYEADDVIGTISRAYDRNGDRVLILSGDKDILQLVNNKVYVVTPELGFGKQKIYNPEEVQKRFGITPGQIPDFKALMGDPSDNYVGAKGIGPKTAAKLLQQFKSVEAVFQHLQDIPEKTQAILEEYRENVLLSHKLATILTDVDIVYDMASSRFNGFDDRLKDFLKKYEMNSLLNRIFKTKKSVVQRPAEKKEEKSRDQLGLF